MKHILIVDDNEDILHAVSLALELNGYVVTAVPSGQSIEQAIVRRRPDLVLLDIMLADRDGREICRALKAQMEYRSIPIILFSASDITRPEALECGANDFIAKPFDLHKLLSTVEALVHK